MFIRNSKKAGDLWDRFIKLEKQVNEIQCRINNHISKMNDLAKDYESFTRLTCRSCGLLIRDIYKSKVIQRIDVNQDGCRTFSDIYFCKHCKPNYDRVISLPDYKKKYEKRVDDEIFDREEFLEVNENGEII